MSNTFIKSIFIKNFRGLRGPIEINFEKNDKQSSLLLWGENGSGKSSILEAIEYAIKGTVHNFPIDNSNSIKFIHDIEQPYIRIIFSDDTAIIRSFNVLGELIVEGDGIHHINDYSYPFLFRRCDILTFLDSPDGKKMLLFKNFFGKNEISYINIKTLNEKIEEAKREKGRIRAEIASITEKDILSIPEEESQLKIYRTKLFSMFYTDEQLESEVDSIIKSILNINKKSKPYYEIKKKTLDKDKFYEAQEKLDKLIINRNEKQAKLAVILDMEKRDIPLKSLDIIQWSKNPLKTIIKNRKKIHDKNIANVLEKKFEELWIVLRNLHDLKEKTKYISSNISINDDLKTRLISSFREIEKWIVDQFVLLSKDDEIKSLNIEYGTTSEVSLTINIEFKSGKNVSPILILSEANQDLLGILFFLGMVKMSTTDNRAKLLILDDVFQSIDSKIRFNTTRMIKEQFQDYQIIVTTHDRLWWEQMSNIYKSAKGQYVSAKLISYRELKRHLITGQANITKIDLADNIDIEKIASSVSMMFEEICYYLSLNMEISVIRKKDDKYTMGDIWPGILKKLKNTEIDGIANDLNNFIMYRNILGAHFNEWAMGIARNDIIQYANLVEKLFHAMYCEKCGNWIQKSNTTDCLYTCKCANIKLKKK